MDINLLMKIRYDKGDNSKKFQKLLRKIKPFSKIDMDQDIPLIKLEKLVRMYITKYNLYIGSISENIVFDNYYSAWVGKSVVSEKRGRENVFLNSIEAWSIYEVFVKICILFYWEVENDEEIVKR